MRETLTRSHRFKSVQTGYHKWAVRQLAYWVNGETEEPFLYDGSIVFVPDVTVRNDGILTTIYEVVYKHPINGRKLGMIEYWCYMTGTQLTVFEVSADYILAQTEKPDRIEIMECYEINIIP